MRNPLPFRTVGTSAIRISWSSTGKGNVFKLCIKFLWILYFLSAEFYVRFHVTAWHEALRFLSSFRVLRHLLFRQITKHRSNCPLAVGRFENPKKNEIYTERQFISNSARFGLLTLWRVADKRRHLPSQRSYRANQFMAW